MITKGDRIQASWLRANPRAALAGMQLKFAATEVTVTGIVRHVRGDRPIDPTIVRIYIDPESDISGVERSRPPGCTCEQAHIELDPNWVRAIL